MKYFSRITLATVLLLLGAMNVMATEEAKYEVLQKDSHFELREYPPQIVAETVVEGSLEDAGSEAFRRLFRYISGENRSRDKIAMTAPVMQQPEGEKIQMTAPVAQQRVQDGWAVSFMMPAAYTLETLPVPDDPQVTLRQLQAQRMAVVRYSGLWSEKSYMKHKDDLDAWIQEQRFTRAGDPVWARYNPPFMPWFLRRNEIMIPVVVDSVQETQPGKVP